MRPWQQREARADESAKQSGVSLYTHARRDRDSDSTPLIPKVTVTPSLNLIGV